MEPGPNNPGPISDIYKKKLLLTECKASSANRDPIKPAVQTEKQEMGSCCSLPTNVQTTVHKDPSQQASHVVQGRRRLDTTPPRRILVVATGAVIDSPTPTQVVHLDTDDFAWFTEEFHCTVTSMDDEEQITYILHDCLISAALEGDLTRVKLCTETTFQFKKQPIPLNVDYQDERGMTALMAAARHGQTDVVQYLVTTMRADTTLLNLYEEDALMQAALQGHAHTVAFLCHHEQRIYGHYNEA